MYSCGIVFYMYDFDDNINIPVPEFIDPVFVKTISKRSFSVIQKNERFGLVFVETGSINSGTEIQKTFRKTAYTVRARPSLAAGFRYKIQYSMVIWVLRKLYRP